MKINLIEKSNSRTWPEIMTIPDLYKAGPFGRNKLLEMANSGELPCKKIRGRWIITRDCYLAWLKGTD